MRISYDSEVDALYIRLIDETVEGGIPVSCGPGA